MKRVFHRHFTNQKFDYVYSFQPQNVIFVLHDGSRDPAHPCLLYRAIAASEAAAEAPVVVMDFGSLMSHWNAEMASPALGSITKPLSRTLRRLNAASLRWVATDARASAVMVKLLKNCNDLAEASQSAILVGPSFDQAFARKWTKTPVLNNVPVEVLGVAEPDASILKAFVPGAGRSSGTANLFCGGIRRRSLYDVP